MAATNFNDGTTVETEWLNEVDAVVHDVMDAATTKADARTALELGTMATQDANNVAITGGSVTGITDLAVADGGTGASTADDARTNLGLGTIATQDASSVAITGGTITGITDLAIADGGTGASTATQAFTNLKQAASDTDTGVIEIAVQSEMEAATSTTLAVTPGRMQYHPGVAKAWVRFNAATGTPSFINGYNFSSTITDNGVGDYTLTFSTAMSSDNYIVIGSSSIGPVEIATVTASTVRVRTYNTSGSLTDAGIVNVVVFGDM